MKKIKIFFTCHKTPLFSRVPKEAKQYFFAMIKNKSVDWNSWWITSFYENKQNYSVLCHLGSKELINDQIQDLWAKAVRKSLCLVKSWDVQIRLVFDKSISSKMRYFLEKWALLAQMRDDFYKSKSDKNPWLWEIRIEWIFNKELITIVEAIDITRGLVTKPSNIIDPEVLVDFVKKNFDKTKWVKVSVLWKSEIEKEKMNLFLAVNRWSKFEAKMVVLDYNPDWKSSDKPIILIWKGLTYDSGGYYFKSYPHMNDMHTDKAWACTVIGIMSVLKKLNIKRRVVWILGITENMIDANSYKNWDIYFARNWKSVEIWHTDAEWRLVLADLLSYAFDKYEPEMVYDIATLTWAVISSLWEMYTWIFWWSQAVLTKLSNLWERINDRVWALPFDFMVKDAIKSKMADISNTSKLSWMLWSSTAAAFLSNFVKDEKKWVHLDIAGSWTRNKMKRAYDLPNGLGTWACIHLLLECVKK